MRPMNHTPDRQPVRRAAAEHLQAHLKFKDYERKAPALWSLSLAVAAPITSLSDARGRPRGPVGATPPAGAGRCLPGLQATATGVGVRGRSAAVRDRGGRSADARGPDPGPDASSGRAAAVGGGRAGAAGRAGVAAR